MKSYYLLLMLKQAQVLSYLIMCLMLFNFLLCSYLLYNNYYFYMAPLLVMYALTITKYIILYLIAIIARYFCHTRPV